MNSMDVREETIFSLLKRADARPSSRATWLWLAGLALIGWVGAVAFIGRYRPHQVVRMLSLLAPRDVLFWGALALALGCAMLAIIAKRLTLSGAALVIAAFLFGHQIYAWLYPHIPARFDLPFLTNADALRFAVSRLGYGVCVVAPMLVAWRIVFGRDGAFWPPLRFGVGDLNVKGRDVSSKAALVPWWRPLIGGYGAFCLVFLVIMQANVGFKPVITGTLWPLLPGVLLAAAANATAEELIFRGVIQPAFIRAGGVAAGLWMQGLMFGLMHWGLSVGILAALPVSLLIGLGSVVWGKAALDTGGLGWVVIAHAMVDVGLMSAFFVPLTAP